MKSRYVVTKMLFRVNSSNNADGVSFPRCYFPVHHNKNKLYEHVVNLEPTVFETYTAAESYADGFAIDDYFFKDKVLYRKAHQVVRGCTPGEYYPGRPYVEHPDKVALTRELTNQPEDVVRWASRAIIEVIVPDVPEEKGPLNPDNILYIKSATLRNGDIRKVYDFALAANPYKAISPTENTAQTYIAMLETYKKGPLWGFFRNHKKQADELIQQIKQYSQAGSESKGAEVPQVSLLSMFKKELSKPKTNISGDYSQCLRAMIEREVQFKR